MLLRRDEGTIADPGSPERRARRRRVLRTVASIAAALAVFAFVPAARADAIDAPARPGEVLERQASLSGLLGLPPDVPVVTEELPAGLTAFAWRFAAAEIEPTPTLVPPTPTPVPPSPTPVRPVVRQPVAPPPAPAATPVPPTPAPPPPAPVGAGLDLSPMNAYEQALFDAINARRVGAGMPALRANIYLAGVGRVRSQDMVDHNYFAHTSPSGQTAFSLLSAYGIPYAWAGENLARNNYPDSETVAVAIRDLMASPSHRDNILNSHYTEMGVAVAIDGAGMKYFTMVFTGPA